MKEYEYLIEEAEVMRKQNFSEESSVHAARLAELPFKGIEDYSIIAMDREDLAVATGLVRVIVDSYKSASNLTKNPARSFTYLENGIEYVRTFYHDPRISEALSIEAANAESNLSGFITHIKRDESMLGESAADFYLGSNRKSLNRFATEKLEESFKSLAEEDPSRPLLQIEIELMKKYTGIKPDGTILLNSLYQMAQRNYDNPHAVATAASWIYAYGINSRNDELSNSSLKVFRDHVTENPEWEPILNKSLSKDRLKKFRALYFGVSSQLLVKPGRKNRLIKDLTE